MLSDSLFEVYKTLREAYENYCDKHTHYSKDICEETEDILNRLNVLRHKIDSGDYYGSYRFYDDNAFIEHKKVYGQLRSQIISEAESKYDKIAMPLFTEYSAKWMWAIDEIGFKRYSELKDKYIKPYIDKYKRKDDIN